MSLTITPRLTPPTTAKNIFIRLEYLILYNGAQKKLLKIIYTENVNINVQ